MDKNCTICRAAFSPLNPKQRSCSRLCSDELRRRRLASNEHITRKRERDGRRYRTPEYKTLKRDRYRRCNQTPEYRARKCEHSAEWYKRNKASHNELARKRKGERLATDPIFKMKDSLRRRLHHAIKNNVKVGSAVRLLGCTVDEAVMHLEAQFLPGMSWENWTVRGWHVDHRVPLSSFDLTDPAQLAVACHYTNLQPLWAKDNLSKGSKILAA